MKYKNIELDFNNDAELMCAVKFDDKKVKVNSISNKIRNAFYEFGHEIFIEEVDDGLVEVRCFDIFEFTDAVKIE